MNILKILLLTMVASLAVVACDNDDGVAERTGKTLDDAGENIGEAVSDAGDAIKEACEDVKDSVDAKDTDC